MFIILNSQVQATRVRVLTGRGGVPYSMTIKGDDGDSSRHPRLQGATGHRLQAWAGSRCEIHSRADR